VIESSIYWALRDKLEILVFNRSKIPDPLLDQINLKLRRVREQVMPVSYSVYDELYYHNAEP